MEASRWWTEGKPWEKLGESSVEKERDGSDDRVDGRKPWEIAFWESSVGKERDGCDDRWTERKTWEIDGNSSGRAPLRRSESEMEATTRWTEGKPWEIAW